MIDVENYIFNAVYDEVAPLCAENGFRKVYTQAPTAFPAVTLKEMDNRTDADRNSNSDYEDYAILTYEAHVYALTQTECRKVFCCLDDAVYGHNFTRMSGAYAPNAGNVKVHEYVARYRVGVGHDGCLFRVS